MKQILMILLTGITVFAGNVVTKIDPKINKFIAGYDKGIYRSSLINSTADRWWQGSNGTITSGFPVQNEDAEHQFNTYKKWVDASDNEYTIVEVPSTELIKQLQKAIGQTGTVLYDSLAHQYLINFNYDEGKFTDNLRTGTYNLITEGGLVASSRTRCRTILAFFRGRIEEDDANIYRFTDVAGNIRTSGTDVTYRRIFRHGIVPSDASHIIVSFDGSGTLKSIAIKWPAFIKINGLGPEPAIDFKTALINGVQSFSEMDTTLADGHPYVCKEADISGMACSWQTLKHDDRLVLSPCFRFQATMRIANGDSTVIQNTIPRLKKYYQ